MTTSALAPFQTRFEHDLPQFADAIEDARRLGAGGRRLETHGNVFAVDVVRLIERGPAGANEALTSAKNDCIIDPIGSPQFVVRGFSETKQEESQFGMPCTSYPFAPQVCASLATGYMRLTTTSTFKKSPDSFALPASLRRSRLRRGQPIFRISTNTSYITVSEVQGERLMYEGCGRAA